MASHRTDSQAGLARLNQSRRTSARDNGHTFKHWPQLCEELAPRRQSARRGDYGEIVCLDGRGPQNFRSLLFRREWPYFYAFDLLAVDGEDLREWPLAERKRRLRN